MNREGTLLITREVRWGWVLWRTATLLGLSLVACTHRDAKPSRDPDSPDQVCVDRDGDGFGEQCPAGPDCNDHDESVHEHCLHCATPEAGCPCTEADQPVACWLDKTTSDAGAIMCHEGTRSCRELTWSECESVHDYPLPERSGSTTALIDPDAGPTQCNDCNVNCFQVTDQLDPLDGGLNSHNSMGVDWVPGGGVTLGIVPGVDAGPPPTPPPVPPCVVGSGVGNDNDCDGIPNAFDPYPDDPPFATANPTIFLNIPPGQTGTGQIDLNFKVNSADVYFLVDQSGSMDQERDKLKASLTTGDFINNAAYQCSDFDFDHVPNNEQKTKGIIGAVRCMIRDANFGVGFFREIPFSNYAANDHVAFANYHDISSNIDSVLAAVNRLTTVGNIDWPEDSMIALNQVLMGNGMYFGTTKRGIPARVNCPSLTWGYPCFRTGAIPIIVMFTDAQFHNGPDSGGGGSFNYATGLSITAGTGSQYYPIDSASSTRNDTFATAVDLGDVGSNYKTYWGTTDTMAEDVTSTYFPCLTETGGKDAVFKFSLSQSKTVKIEATGSQFDTLLGLYTGVPGPASALPASTNANEIGTSALSLGQASGGAFVVTGSTNSMVSNYQWSEVGCSASTAAPDAVFKFDVGTANTQVMLDTTGSAFDTVLGLYAAEPSVAPTYSAVTQVLLNPNPNEDYSSAQAVGDVNNKFLAYTGNTSAMASNYTNSQIGCNADNNAPDATFGFSLTATRTVRISTEGSSFNTVLGLYSGNANPVGNSAVPATNEDYSSAYDVGTLDGHILKLTGTTSGMDANLFANQVGCNANTLSPDAVFKFHLNSIRNVQIDTIGTTGWDSILALYNQAPDATTQVTAPNNNEAFASAYNLGTINSKDVVINAGDTTGMGVDFNSSSTSNPCSQSSGGQTAPDAAYRFKVTSATTVKIDTTGTTAFDSTLAVHALPPTEPSAPQGSTNDTVATAANVGSILNTSFQRTGDTSSFAHNYNFTGAHTSARDAVYQFTLPSTTTVQIDTAGTVNLDTAIALYGAFIPNLAASATTSTGITSNNLVALPYDPGGGSAMDDKWRVLSGSTSSATSDLGLTSCSTNSNSPDVYYKFTLSTPRTVTIGLSSGSFSNARALLYSPATALATPSSSNYTTCTSVGNSISPVLQPGTYYVVVKGTGSTSKGSYDLTIRDVTPSTLITTNDDVVAGSDTTSLISTSLGAGTYTVVVSAHTNTYGPYTIRFRDKTYWDSFGYVTCQNGSGNVSTIEQTFQPGDYGIIVKGRTRTAYGPYALRVTDTQSPPAAPGVLTCDDNTGGSTTAKIVRNLLPAGDYWVILKGNADADYGNYTLNMKDTAASASGALLQCDDDGGDTPTSMIERSLTAGSYQVIVKGKAATDKGAYKVTIRDVTSKPINRLGCDNDSGGVNGSSKLTATLGVGSYYAVLKGKTAADKGAYALTLRDTYNRPNTTYVCDDDGSTYNTSKISTTLGAGTYYAVLKGYNAGAYGPYQLSIGAGTTSSATYTPPSWTTTLANIKAKSARVITILSCKDDPEYGDASGECNQARYQANTLATESKALGASNNKLVFDITRDGTGLSNSVVTAITQLANYLAMNVKVRVVLEPDANPGFDITVRAIDEAGDGCSGLIGLEHQNCLPGASPRFLLDFKNRADHPVPRNPADTKGGYSFRAELIGNDQFIVDQIPIYIIPEAVPVPPVPPPDYYESGEYKQDITAGTCNQTERPDWTDLNWSANVYKNTSVTFNMCTATTQADLDTCQNHQIAKVTGTTACSSTTPCSKGFCDGTIGVCQVVTGGACTTSAACASNAYCDTTAGVCTYNSQPALIGRALGTDNLKPYMRLTVGLAGVEPITEPPVVHSWQAKYECRGTQ